MLESRFYYLIRSRFSPGEGFKLHGAVYIGVHGSSDPNFGTQYGSDPFVGTGKKVRDLIEDLKAHNVKNIRALWNVEVIMSGTHEQCQNRFLQIDIPFDHPLCLNSKEGAPAGVPKTEEHKENISKALETAMVGNINALGAVHESIDESLDKLIKESGKVMKWVNDGDKSKLVALDKDKNDEVILPEGFSLGKAKKKA